MISSGTSLLYGMILWSGWRQPGIVAAPARASEAPISFRKVRRVSPSDSASSEAPARNSSVSATSSTLRTACRPWMVPAFVASAASSALLGFFFSPLVVEGHWSMALIQGLAARGTGIGHWALAGCSREEAPVPVPSPHSLPLIVARAAVLRRLDVLSLRQLLSALGAAGLGPLVEVVLDPRQARHLVLVLRLQQGLPGVAVAVQAPAHAQRLGVVDLGHRRDHAVARVAAHARVHVGLVREVVHVVGDLVDAPPLDRLILVVSLPDELRLALVHLVGVVLLEAAFLVTPVTGRHVRDVRLVGLLDLGVAVAAVHAQLARVDLVVEPTTRLLGHVADLEELRRRVVVEPRHHCGQAHHRADADDGRQHVHPLWEDHRHGEVSLAGGAPSLVLDRKSV